MTLYHMADTLLTNTAGNVAFFSFMSEMRNPREYPKALYTLQGTATALYLVVAGVIYYYAGAAVKSPALGSAGPSVRKVAYYLAIPTIVVAGVINGHVAIKMAFLSFKQSLVSSKSKRAYAWWAALDFVFWGLAWVLAESIPNFGNLLALVSALLGTLRSWRCSEGYEC